MKKVLNILSTISLSTIITTNIIACKAKNINNKPNKRTEPQFIPQQPPTNNNWKIVTDYNSFLFNKDNKFYFFVFQPFNSKQWKILKFKHDTDYAKEIDGFAFVPSDINVYVEANRLKSLYRWDGINEPTIPTIDKNIGEITNWNEKIES